MQVDSDHLEWTVRSLERALEMHLSHRTGRADEDGHSARSKLRAIAALAVGGRDHRTRGADIGGVVVMDPANVDVGGTVERFVADEVEHAAEGQRIARARDEGGRLRVENDDVVERALRLRLL